MIAFRTLAGRTGAPACVATLAILAGCASKPQSAVLPAPTRPAPQLPSATAPEHIVAGPYVQPASRDLAAGLRVVWWSDVPGAGRLTWRTGDGKTGGESASEQLPFRGWVRHVATMPRGSAEGAAYTVDVTTASGRSVARSRSVRFAPRSGGPVRFAAIGDSGAGTKAQREVAEGILKKDVSLVLIAGDVVYGNGTWDEYKRNLFPQYAELMASVPIAPALGNHDIGANDNLGRPFRAVWLPPLNWSAPAEASGPYTVTRRRSIRGEGPISRSEAMGRNYSIDLGKCHIVCLDSTVDAATMREQVAAWAQADLADARRRGQTWLIAFWHHPPYTRGAYRDSSGQWQDVRDILVPPVREGGVRVVINGHDHNYQHLEKDGVHYVVSGSGGARLYDVVSGFSGAGQPPLLGFDDKAYSFTLFELDADARTLQVSQVATDGRTLDRWSLSTP